MEFSGGSRDPKTKERLPLVRARIQVQTRFQKNIHDNATFYITTQGVLGEQFLAIDPGSRDRSALDDGAVVRGLDPPRLDRLIAEDPQLAQQVKAWVDEHLPTKLDISSQGNPDGHGKEVDAWEIWGT